MENDGLEDEGGNATKYPLNQAARFSDWGVRKSDTFLS